MPCAQLGKGVKWGIALQDNIDDFVITQFEVFGISHLDDFDLVDKSGVNRFDAGVL